MVSLPSEMLLNGGTVVGLPSEELLAEIWHSPKKQLWQNCRGGLCSQEGRAGKGKATKMVVTVEQGRAGKRNATKVVLTVEQNNWSPELAPMVRKIASVSGRR